MSGSYIGSFCRKYCLHEKFPADENGCRRLFNIPAILLTIIYIYTIVSYVIRHAYADKNGNIQYCESPSLILAICQIGMYIVCIIIAIMSVYEDILKFKESMILCGFPWFFLFVTYIVDAKRIGGCQYFQVVIDLLGYFVIFYLWSSKPHPLSGLFCVILHIAFMCLIIVLTDHSNSDVLHLLLAYQKKYYYLSYYIMVGTHTVTTPELSKQQFFPLMIMKAQLIRSETHS